MNSVAIFLQLLLLTQLFEASLQRESESLRTESPRRVNRRPWIISNGPEPTRRRYRPRTGTRPTRTIPTRRSRTTQRPRSSTSVWTTRGYTVYSVNTIPTFSVSTSPRVTSRTTSIPTRTTFVPVRTPTSSARTTTMPLRTSTLPVSTTTTPPAPPTYAMTTTKRPTKKPTFNPTRTPRSTTSTSTIGWTETDQTSSGKPVTPSRSPNQTIEIVPFKDSCLECICEGSGCNFKDNCDNEGECGPYKIDYAYWYEAGYPGYDGNEGDFKKCVQSKDCAETTVKKYIARYAKDCNDDSIIDCIDYAALHKSGPDQCSKQWVYESKFWTTFSFCYGFDFRR